MKNKILVVLLAALVGGIRANDDAGQLAVALTQAGVQLYAADQKQQKQLPSESQLRRLLYWLDKNNPLFFKMDDFQKNFDYYIAVLTEHIKVLEGKIALKQNGLKSKGMCTGLITSTLSALSGYGAYYFYHARKDLQADAALKTIGNITGHSQDLMCGCVYFGIASVLLAAVTAHQFHKVYRYAERLRERLERDKRILATLEKEKAANYTAKLNNVVTQEAVLKVVEAVLGAIESVVKPKAA